MLLWISYCLIWIYVLDVKYKLIYILYRNHQFTVLINCLFSLPGNKNNCTSKLILNVSEVNLAFKWQFETYKFPQNSTVRDPTYGRNKTKFKHGTFLLPFFIFGKIHFPPIKTLKFGKHVSACQVWTFWLAVSKLCKNQENKQKCDTLYTN